MMINNGVGALLLVPLALSPTRFGELGHVHEIAAFDARQWALLLLSCINGVAISSPPSTSKSSSPPPR